MKQLNSKWLMALATVGVMLVAGSDLASTPIPKLVSGTVTGVSGNQIAVDGTNYSVDVQSPALRTLEQVHAGEQVQLVLTGPPGSASARVEGIQVRSGS